MWWKRQKHCLALQPIRVGLSAQTSSQAAALVRALVVFLARRTDRRIAAGVLGEGGCKERKGKEDDGQLHLEGDSSKIVRC
jgi:hypothetical protein